MADKRKRTSSDKSKGGVVASVVEQTTHVAGETTRIASEMLDSAANIANTARATGAEWVAGVSPTAADLLRPGGGKKAQGVRAARQPRKTAAGKATTKPAGAACKTAASVGKATARATKAARSATKQVVRGAQKAARQVSTTTAKRGAKRR
jgi:hypothetical protein